MEQKLLEGSPRDFLSRLLASANSVRLSLRKAAPAFVGESHEQEIRVAPSFSAHVRFGGRGAPVVLLLSPGITS